MDKSRSWLLWLFFVVFEVVVFLGLYWLLADLGMSDQYQAENTVVPNWVKAVSFVLLYILILLLVIMLVSSYVPSKNRGHLMRWVYLALLGMIVMLFFLF